MVIRDKLLPTPSAEDAATAEGRDDKVTCTIVYECTCESITVHCLQGLFQEEEVKEVEFTPVVSSLYRNTSIK